MCTAYPVGKLFNKSIVLLGYVAGVHSITKEVSLRTRVSEALSVCVLLNK